MCVCCRSPLQQAHKRKLKGTVAQGCGCCSRCQGGSDSMFYVVQKCIFTISTRHSNFFKHYYYIVPALRNFHQNCRTLRFRRSSQFLYSDGLVNAPVRLNRHTGAFRGFSCSRELQYHPLLQSQEEVSHLAIFNVWQVNNVHLLLAHMPKGSTNVSRWKLAIDFTAASDICTVNEMNERDWVFSIIN